MSTGSERMLSVLSDIGNSLKSLGESFVTAAGERVRQRTAIQDLGLKIDKLQSTANEIKTAVAETKA